jgi:WD40 repeat protein
VGKPQPLAQPADYKKQKRELAETMSTRFIATALLIVFCSACSANTPTPLPMKTAPSVLELPPIPTITPEADVLRSWGDKDTVVTSNRLGKGNVYAMALSPDGNTIAVTGLVSVTTYDFASLKEIWTSLLEPRQPPANTGRGQVVWSPDGSQLATNSEVGMTVWDAKTGEQLDVFKGDLYRSGSIVWTQDGKLAITTYFAGNKIILDVRTGDELLTIEMKGSPADVAHILQSKDLLAEAVSDQGIVVQDTRSGEKLYSPLEVCDGYCISVMKLSPDGTRVVVGFTDEYYQLGVWDLATQEKMFAMEAPGNYFAETTLVWSPDSKYLAAAFNTGTLRVWDSQTGNQLHSLTVDKIEGLDWSPDGNNLISLSQYGTMIVWDIETGKPLRSMDEDTSWIMSLAWSPDGSMLAAGAEDGEISIWEPASGKKLRSLQDPARWVSNLTWSPDGKQIAEGGVNAINIWDVETGQRIRAWHVPTLALSGLAWSPKGGLLASISDDGTPILWDPATGEELRRLSTNWSSEDLLWSPEGDLLSTSYPASGLGGEQVTLWDPHMGKPVLTKQGVHTSAWSPLGDMVASISDNKTGYMRDDTALVLWDPQTGEELRRFDTGTFLTNTGWSPDGKYLIAGGAQEVEHALIVLDAQTGEQLHSLKGHYNVIAAAAWSPRGDLIASASPDGTVIIWRLDQ